MPSGAARVHSVLQNVATSRSALAPSRCNGYASPWIDANDRIDDSLRYDAREPVWCIRRHDDGVARPNVDGSATFDRDASHAGTDDATHPSTVRRHLRPADDGTARYEDGIALHDMVNFGNVVMGDRVRWGNVPDSGATYDGQRDVVVPGTLDGDYACHAVERHRRAGQFGDRLNLRVPQNRRCPFRARRRTRRADQPARCHRSR